MLRPDGVVAELKRFPQGQFQHLLGSRGERWRTDEASSGQQDCFCHLGAGGIEPDPELRQRPGGDALAFMDEAEEDVLSPDEAVIEQPGFLLGQHEDSATAVCKALEHGNSVGRCSGRPSTGSGRRSSMSGEDPKRLVQTGYEQAASRYDEWSKSVDAEPRHSYVTLLNGLLQRGSRVLELGCGTGLATRQLTQSFEVVAIDFASSCLDLARQAAPQASFVRADMTQFACRSASFDAVVAFYSLIHVPRAEQPRVLRDVARWLRPGGVLLANFGTNDSDAGYEDDWRGVRMFWSAYDSETNLRNVADAGFYIIQANEVSQEEDGESVTFQWIVAQLPSPPSGSAGYD